MMELRLNERSRSGTDEADTHQRYCLWNTRNLPDRSTTIHERHLTTHHCMHAQCAWFISRRNSSAHAPCPQVASRLHHTLHAHPRSSSPRCLLTMCAPGPAWANWAHRRRTRSLIQSATAEHIRLRVGILRSLHLGGFPVI